jgi:hypothetical protein
MLKSRFAFILVMLSMLVVTLAVSQPFSKAVDFSQSHIMDSATRSYIAWGEALEATGKLGDAAACSNTIQGEVFASIPDILDSATRSYMAWGLALQAKDDMQACR